MKKKKIIHFIGHLHSGGAETLVKDYAINFNKDKYEFIVLIQEDFQNTIIERNLIENGIKIISLAQKVKYDQSDNLFTRSIKKLRRHLLFRKIIREEQPDVIHTHLILNSYLLFIDTKKIRLFHTIHNEVNVIFGGKRIFHRLCTKYCISKKGMVLIALHDRMRKEANELFTTKNTIVLNNAVNIDKFKNTNINIIDKKKELGLDESTFVVGHIGRFSLQKNHEFLINIYKEVKEVKKNAHLVLVGIGELQNKIRHQVKMLGLEDSVSFLNAREDISELLHVMDVFVFPSNFEGFPIVLLEAQVSRVKCIISDTIPSDIILTDNIKVLSLNDSTTKWVDEIISQEEDLKEDIMTKLEKFDIHYIVKELELLYS